MKIKFGAIVTDGRNKIGGHVASKNKAGNYLKTKSTPTNPSTTYQSAVRQNFGSLAQSWRGLTQVQRDSWISGAPNFPYTDIFGDTKILSGFSLYMQLNSNLNSVGATLLETCPSAASVSGATINSVEMTTNTTMSVDFLPAPVPAGHAFVLSATPILTDGRAFSKSQIRQIHVLPAATATAFNANNYWTGRFGEFLGTSKIYFGLHSVLLATGQVSPMTTVLAAEA